MWPRHHTTSISAQALINQKWDALVIGAGHNGLTAAAYLARSGLSVAVLERRHVIGGAAVTEELVPGFKFSRCSYLQSLLRPTVIKELELGRHGLKLLKRNPASFTPCVDGRYLLLGTDKTLNHSQISKFSKRDAEAYPRYERELENFCKFMDPLLDSSPPEKLQEAASFNFRMKDNLQKSVFWAQLMQRAVAMGNKELLDFMDLLLSPASKVLNNWFEADVLKATLATDAVIGTTGSVSTPGSGYVLLHHVMGETDGDRGIWSFVEGGMGSVSLAISRAAKEAGVTIMTETEATTKINLAVEKLPQFHCCKLNSPDAGPQHMGTIHIGAERMEEIESACLDSLNGIPSRRPIIEMTIPSALDKTISPPGKHVINLFIQYTPYKPSDGSWEDSEYRSSFAQRCFDLIEEYAPGFNSSIIGYDMLTPPDLEREIGLTGGNIFHGAMGLDSLFLMRPVKGCSNYRTPVKGLYLCGSGAHPGGGVMGAPGRNAALVAIQDIKAQI
ncbi:pyridine nucleotide-disulfide oxidoreductase domain-containing protein 2 isoform X2 [Salvia hispanica]|uniref:pyridine nucleotide-disulfide oxidoreductase domain-containing protein 2 isoform X2 n=1 Tax=Salvia hispanica TaxID=49212 RepID=UPI002008FB6B|nr:pyridine nucleotide-disulfide oxidoreductase domain-containing protein 2 isoform X2 [Salvia hispanica]